MRERELHAAVGDRRQHARLLRIAGTEAHRGAAEHHGRQIRLQDQRAAERLHHQHDLDRAAAEPTVFLGERQTEQPKFGVLRPQRGAPAARLLEMVLALIERIAVGHQPIDAVLQQALFIGEGEVHLAFPVPFLTSWPGLSRPSVAASCLDSMAGTGPAMTAGLGGGRQSRSTALVRMFFWISLVPP